MDTRAFTKNLPAELAAVIKSKNIECTDDGYFLLTTSVRQLLKDAGFTRLIDEDGIDLSVDAYDDWHLTAIAKDGEIAYSLIKIREPGDDQGRTGNAVPFVALNINELGAHLKDKNLAGIYAVLTRVTNPEPKDQSEFIRRYYADFNSKGSYLIADYTVRKVIKHFFAGGNHVWNIEHPFADNDPWAQEYLRSTIELGIYNSRENSITVKNPAKPTLKERCAILALATGNASAHSLAGENLWHAHMLGDNSHTSLLGAALTAAKSAIRSHAIASDASVGCNAAELVYEQLFKDTESDIYKKLTELHNDWN